MGNSTAELITTRDKSKTWSDIDEDLVEFEGTSDLISDRKWNVIFGEEEKLDTYTNDVINQTEKIDYANKSASIKVHPIIFMPPKKSSREYFISFKKWRGVVTELCDETFWATLIDMQNDTADEEAEIYKSELSDEDQKMLSIGAVFYWSIGYHTTEYGQRKRESIIRFRRLPIWSLNELDRIKKRARIFIDGLNIT